MTGGSTGTGLTHGRGRYVTPALSAAGVPVWWVGDRGIDLFVATTDRTIAVLVADAAVRHALGDSLLAAGRPVVGAPTVVRFVPAGDGRWRWLRVAAPDDGVAVRRVRAVGGDRW